LRLLRNPAQQLTDDHPVSEQPEEAVGNGDADQEADRSADDLNDGQIDASSPCRRPRPRVERLAEW
jgi:hypothetical protein